MPNTSNTHYDYIISGAGAAGLSLLVRMITGGKFTDKRILLLDKEPKLNCLAKNDKNQFFLDAFVINNLEIEKYFCK